MRLFYPVYAAFFIDKTPRGDSSPHARRVPSLKNIPLLKTPIYIAISLKNSLINIYLLSITAISMSYPYHTYSIFT